LFFFFEPQWIPLGTYTLVLDPPSSIGDNGRLEYGDELSPGEREIVERFVLKLEEELCKRLDFNVRLSTTSLTRGSFIQFGPFFGDPTGILNRLLKIAGITAAIGSGIVNFEQAVIRYPEVRQNLPVLLADVKLAFSEVSKTVAIGKGMWLKENKIESLEVETVGSETDKALNRSYSSHVRDSLAGVA
jgi:hypothetical protein